MGFAILAYLVLGISGIFVWSRRQAGLENGDAESERFFNQGEDKLSNGGWLFRFHYVTGWILVSLVLLLLAIGIVGTLGHYGNLGHSTHLPAGIAVVLLVLLSAGTATQITPEGIWMRSLHVGINIAMLLGLIWVSWTGWDVVQKYL